MVNLMLAEAAALGFKHHPSGERQNASRFLGPNSE
jgi:hypothetical protein